MLEAACGADAVTVHESNEFVQRMENGDNYICLRRRVNCSYRKLRSRKSVEVEFKPVKVSGGSEIKRTMTMAKTGKLDGNFIEGMMCEGGCLNGAAKIVPVMKAKAPFTNINQQLRVFYLIKH